MKNKKAFFISLAAILCIAAVAITLYFTLPAKTADNNNTTKPNEATTNSSVDIDDDSWKLGTTTNERISNYVDTHNDTFANSYAGMYFDSTGKLNILLTGKRKECNKFLLDTFGFENTCKTIVKYSYKELTSTQEKIEKLVAENNEKKNKKNSVIDAITDTTLNVRDNNICVTLYTQTGAPDEELIAKFKKEVNDSEMITFEFTNYKPVDINN